MVEALGNPAVTKTSPPLRLLPPSAGTSRVRGCELGDGVESGGSEGCEEENGEMVEQETYQWKEMIKKNFLKFFPTTKVTKPFLCHFNKNSKLVISSLPNAFGSLQMSFSTITLSSTCEEKRERERDLV